MTDLSSEVLKAFEERTALPVLLLHGLPCPFLRRYRPMELSDIYDEEKEETNITDTVKELE